MSADSVPPRAVNSPPESASWTSCCHGRRRFERFFEVRSAPGSEVSVPHRHGDRAVTQPVLGLIQRHTRARQLAREAVPKVVPPDLPQPCPSARAP